MPSSTVECGEPNLTETELCEDIWSPKRRHTLPAYVYAFSTNINSNAIILWYNLTLFLVAVNQYYCMHGKWKSWNQQDGIACLHFSGPRSGLPPGDRWLCPTSISKVAQLLGSRLTALILETNIVRHINVIGTTQGKTKYISDIGETFFMAEMHAMSMSLRLISPTEDASSRWNWLIWNLGHQNK